MKSLKKIKVNDIIEAPFNYNKHPKEQLEEIKKSLTKFGQYKNVVLWQGNQCIAGNGLVMAAKELGFETLSCYIADDLSEEDAKKLCLTDNAAPYLAVADSSKLQELLDSLPNIDDIPAVNNDWLNQFLSEQIASENYQDNGSNDKNNIKDINTDIEPIIKRGDLFQLGKHRVLCGDCTDFNDISFLMDNQKADLWITDPPYGVSYSDKNVFLNSIDKGNRNQKNIENDHLSIDQMYEFWKKVASNIINVTTDKCSYYWFACQGGDQMMMMMMSLSESEWKVRHELIWVKNNHVLGRTDYNYKHEPIIYGWKKEGTHNFYGGFQTSVLNFDKPLKNDLHPTMKPVDLICLLIQNSSKPTNIVIDTFLGSGTTLIASEITNRICYGMEISEAYCEVIINRYIQNCNNNKKEIEFKHLNGNLKLEQFINQ